VDRLIALVVLRWRLEARTVLGSRGRLVGLLVALPALAFLSLAAALVAYTFARVGERTEPDLVLPVLSALAAVFGLTWALSPLLAGIAATETHDLGKLLTYPVSLPVLVASSLASNLLQPIVLAQLPPLAALALGLGGVGPRALVALVGLALAFSLVVASGQTVGLALHAISRHRRLHDRALLLGIALGVALSVLPVVLLIQSGTAVRRFALLLLEHDVFALVPFTWGVRAAVHAGRGEALLFLGWGAGAVLALAAVLGFSSVLAQRLYRGGLDVGNATSSRGGRARMRLPGAVGAVVEKDLRLVWRDPRLKALVFTGVIGPILLLFVFWQGSGGALRPGVLIALASFTGMGALGSNAFAFERQGLGLLFGLPADRFSILLGKNLAVLVLRVPALVALSLATLVVGGAGLVPAVATVVVLTQALAAAADNYLSILAPTPVAAAGRDPSTSLSGTRGLGAAALLLVAVLATLVLSLPFVFLAWLPHLLGERWLGAVSLPLALAGAAAVYFMATSGSARLLERREPELVARMAGED
jgi:ABC-2 type transport system permease protein